MSSSSSSSSSNGSSSSIAQHTPASDDSDILIGESELNDSSSSSYSGAETATSALIRRVSSQAGECIQGIRAAGKRPDMLHSQHNDNSGASACQKINNISSPDVSVSARGVWKYTVGLVGKPSAGKSTFYNVATRAAFSRYFHGRKGG